MSDARRTTRPSDPPHVALGVANTIRPTRSMLAIDGGGDLDLSPGVLIEGTYRVLGPLGEGGMGIVVRAVDERLEREVAIKLIHPERVRSRATHDLFLREARAMARVRHANLVEIHAFGELHGVPYFVMEYVPGTDLDAWLGERCAPGRLPSLDEAIGVLDQLCRGVTAMHEAGAVHRDLKPSNVLIGAGFRVAVSDLGLARRASDTAIGEHVAGTPAYMAPEIAARRPVAARWAYAADLYSLGVMAFELFTGRLPFEVADPAEMLAAHLHETPPPPSRFRPELPGSFDRVVLSALAKEPAQRQASVDAFRRELLRARERLSRGVEAMDLLVADDDPSCRTWAGELLSAAFPSARVHSAVDGSAALEQALRHPPAVAVVDLNMPGLNGVELTAALRASPRTHDVPIVVITGVGGAPDWALLSQLGASGFLVKPVDPDALLAVVRRLASRRGAAG
jgi:serine/threonine-protein kinase